MREACLAAALLVLAAGLAPGLVGRASAEGQATDVLTAESYWRWHVTLRKPTVFPAKGEAGAATILPASRWVDHFVSPAAPAGWTRADLDDSRWPRSRASWLRGLACARFSSAVVSLRGKFQVTDPAAVKELQFS